MIFGILLCHRCIFLRYAYAINSTRSTSSNFCKTAALSRRRSLDHLRLLGCLRIRACLSLRSDVPLGLRQRRVLLSPLRRDRLGLSNCPSMRDRFRMNGGPSLSRHYCYCSSSRSGFRLGRCCF